MAYNHEFPYTDPYRGNADWLINKVKEFAATLDSWQETIDELLAALEELDDYDSRITALEKATADLNTIRANIADLQKLTEDQGVEIETLRKEILNITDLWSNVMDTIEANKLFLMTYTNYKFLKAEGDIESLRVSTEASIKDILERLNSITPVDIYNPMEASRFSLDKNNALIYGQLRDLGLSNAEFMEMGLTNDEFAAYGLTNRMFGCEGKKWLHWFKVFSPISGVKMTLENALSDIVTFIFGSLTNDEFAALDLSNDDYAALDLTNVERLLYFSAAKGLTNDEYADIIKSGGSGLLRL